MPQGTAGNKSLNKALFIGGGKGGGGGYLRFP